MSLNRYRYAIIGTGRPWKTEGATGFGMAHSHRRGFQLTERTELVAIADVRDDNARLFLEKYNSPAKIYHDYREMLREERPDIVSITTWPYLHAEMTIAACEAGVKAVHCEKPMATTWSDAQRMKAAADASGTIVTFNHQRRFLESFQRAVQMIRSGDIGELQRIEGFTGDMFDWGTHWLNMFQFYTGEEAVEWVMGQIDSRKERKAFGADMEEQAICTIQWRNGVRGLLLTGKNASIGGATHRITGSEGVLEIWNEQPCLRLRLNSGDWQPIETVEGLHGEVAIDRACADLVRALDEPGHVPLLSIDNALSTSEIIFATYYSSLYRGRVDFPLNYPGNALTDMISAGQVGPNRHSA